MQRSSIALFALVLSLLLGPGCQTNSMVNSLDDLTAQVDQQGFLSLQQQRVISLSGLVPSGAPGTVYRYKGTRSPFTAIGISSMEEAGKQGKRSYYLRREIDSGKSFDELVALRNKLVEVRLQASEVIRKRVQRLARLAAQAEASEIAELEMGIEQAQEDFNEAWKAVIEDVDAPGVLIIRTDKKVDGNLAARVGAILGLSGSRSRETGGFAVLGGLRTSFLFLGEDLSEDHWAQPPGRDWNLIGTRFPFVLGTELPFLGQWNKEDMKIVTSKLEAEHVLYSRDQLSESQIQGNLKASVDQLRDLSKTLQEVDEVAIEGVLNAVEGLGNVGILGAAEQSIHPVDGDPEEGTVWQTVYQVMSDYDDLCFQSAGRPRFHFTRWF